MQIFWDENIMKQVWIFISNILLIKLKLYSLMETLTIHYLFYIWLFIYKYKFLLVISELCIHVNVLLLDLGLYLTFIL